METDKGTASKRILSTGFLCATNGESCSFLRKFFELVFYPYEGMRRKPLSPRVRY